MSNDTDKFPSIKSMMEFKKWVTTVTGSDDDTYGKSTALKVFHINLNDISDKANPNKVFENAQQVAWRHIHEDAAGPCAFEIRIGKEHDDLQEIDRGQMAIEYKTLIGNKEILSSIQLENYEITFLRVFALKINAFWLRSQNEPDYFIPIPPLFHGIVAGKLYSKNEFLEILRKAFVTFISVYQR